MSSTLTQPAWSENPNRCATSKDDSSMDIVISGISGTFPESNNVKEFQENLFTKKDMVTPGDRRNNPEFEKKCYKMGKLKELNRFDAGFFGMPSQNADSLDPGSRILLEKTYETIVDAGYNPKHFKGTNTGVFVATTWTPFSNLLVEPDYRTDRYTVNQIMTALMANRISFWLDVQGPSFTVDSACSSSLCAVDLAYNSIKNGHCDAAFVGTSNISLLPTINEMFEQAHLLSTDKSRSFDNEGSGMIRSECVAVILLQRRKDARRVYARLIHTKTNCDGYKNHGMHEPSSVIIHKLLKEFYEECQVQPENVKLMEAHAAGTQAGDFAEMKAIEAVLCREGDPLLIGSVKSNMGHAEAASGLCAIIKLLIAFETGFIPPTLHFKTPRCGIESLQNGKLKVVTNTIPWNGGLAAVDNLGFGGTNSHALLEPNTKIKLGKTSNFELPFLVLVSGRTEEAVDLILKDLEREPHDAEFVGLLHEIFKDPISNHFHRGYTILQKNEDTIIRSIEETSGKERPIWLIFSGMGSQWPTMGASLMKIPIVAESIRRSHETLLPKGVDYIKILTEPNSQNVSDAEASINAFISIVGIQIALIDLLRKVEIEPSGFVGHSMGEISCAYADGCVTAEQALLLAYYRGVVLTKHQLIKGSMASVGLGYRQVMDMKPAEIDIACHNAPDNCTVSGPSEIVKEFVKKLQKDNFFVREVHSYDTAAHSRYNKDAALILNENNKNIITQPKLRSKRWKSTSFLKKDWETDLARYCSGEYFTESVSVTVYFEEACKEIPKDAIVVEVAPHGLLQSILKRSLGSSVTNIPLTSRNHPDNAVHVLKALGNIYTAGSNFCISKLYPPVEFPVSRGTRMISPLVKWDHGQEWHVSQYEDQKHFKNGTRKIIVSLENEENRYLENHVVNGQNLYPGAGYLILAWETLGMSLQKPYTELPVVFENVKFLRMIGLPQKGRLEFTVHISDSTNNFTVTESGDVVATGKIYALESEKTQLSGISCATVKQNEDDSNELPLKSSDVYKELLLRGYHYKGLFCGITNLNPEGTSAKICWKDNFLCFIDHVLQLTILPLDTRSLLVPESIQKLTIDTRQHSTILEHLDSENPEFLARINKEIGVIECGGLEISNVQCIAFSKREPVENVLMEKFEFVPYINPKLPNLNAAFSICAQIFSENLADNPIQIVELIDDFTNLDGPLTCQLLREAYRTVPLIEPNISIIKNDIDLSKVIDKNEKLTVTSKPLPCDESCSIVIASNILQRKEILQKCFMSVKNQGFLLIRENDEGIWAFQNQELIICFRHTFNNEHILLLRKTRNFNKREPIVVKISNDSYSWMAEIQKHYDFVRMNRNQLLILVAEKEEFSGILGLSKSLRLESPHENIKCFYIMDKTAPPFSISHPLYKQQLQKHVLTNVYLNGTWCSYYHFPIDKFDTVQVPHAYINALTLGDLNSTKWVQGSLNPKTFKSETRKLIHVYSAGLNFKDVVLAMKKLPAMRADRRQQDCLLGLEFSGKTDDGSRFMGMVPSKGTANLVECDNAHMWPVPNTWTSDDAATVPITYSTVLYALIECGKLKNGDSILIHSAAGGVGIAALNVCLHYECEMFVTVGTPEKRDFIRRKFPQIPENRIGNSRNTSFEQMIKKETGGKGVRLVLNSLTGEKQLASIRCLAENGRFLELGRLDFESNSSLDQRIFLKNISFHAVDLTTVFHDENIQRIIHSLMQKAIDDRIIKPLPRTIFSSTEVEAAYRYLASGKNIGKVVIKIREEDKILNQCPETLLMKAVPQYLCSPEKSYILCGGLGGLGMELADWLILRGARNLILSSRRMPYNGYQTSRIRLWRSYGVNVIISTDDITTEDGVKNLLQTANKTGPVSAIFNLAVAFSYRFFNLETEETFREMAGPKNIATFFLDKWSRQLCPHLQNFVVFSSLITYYGGATQTSYSMANSILERICEKRKSENLPALAIQWGPISEVGIISEKMKLENDVLIVGFMQKNIQSCLRSLEIFLTQPYAVVGCGELGSKKEFLITNESMAEIVANVLGIQNTKTIDANIALAEFGMDSLSNMEIKNKLEKKFNVFFNNEQIKKLTFAQLHKMDAEFNQKQ